MKQPHYSEVWEMLWNKLLTLTGCIHIWSQCWTGCAIRCFIACCQNIFNIDCCQDDDTDWDELGIEIFILKSNLILLQKRTRDCIRVSGFEFVTLCLNAFHTEIERQPILTIIPVMPDSRASVYPIYSILCFLLRFLIHSNLFEEKAEPGHQPSH